MNRQQAHEIDQPLVQLPTGAFVHPSDLNVRFGPKA